MILIIDNYDSFTYNIYQYLEEMGENCQVIRNDEITLEEIEKLAPKAIVISPGPGNPDSSGISIKVVEAFYNKIPILGVCLGHQIIGQVFGGKVIRAKKAIHGKTSKIFHEQKGVYKGMTSPLNVVRYHSLIVEKESLPDCLEITSETQDGIIMGLKHKKYPVEGIQFHPESVMTEQGKQMLKNFCDGVLKREA
ncbi:MAG: aminodeoxychorismate/anthranilate synthase component II [Candidatus Sericytochromatia bacterium]